MEEYITNETKETITLGEKIGKNLKKGAIICLYGQLGSGKTTFVQGIAKGLGIQKRLISPTFIILRTYDINPTSGSRIINFYHVDLYRTEGEDDVRGIGLDEILKNKEDIVAIEWAEKLGDLLPKKRIDIYFEEHNGGRKIKIRHE